MFLKMTRRAAMLGSVAVAAAVSFPALAQDAPTFRFSAVFSDQDIRASMMNQLTDEVRDIAVIEPYFGGTLFRQGTELVALQRGNLEMGNIAPQDISNQIPEWSLLTSAYLFRDAEHLRTFFDSEIGDEFKQMAEDQLGIHILGPTYFGSRQVGLRGDREINTPEDMNGIRLRMPGGDAWQFLGTALGANPTPMDYAEVYTGLQTGAIDGQDNPLPNVQNMKFFEVMDQIVLTSHLVGYDLLVVSSDAWIRKPSRRLPMPPSTGARTCTSRWKPSFWPSSRAPVSISTSPISMRSAPMRRSSTSTPISRRAGLKARSRKSTRSKHNQGRRAIATAPFLYFPAGADCLKRVPRQ